jgi:alcohol dehydrogenase class IV
VSKLFEGQNPYYTVRSFYFAPGIRSIIADKLEERGVKKPFILFDKGVESVGIPQKIIDALKPRGFEITTFSEVEADPPTHVVNSAASVGKKAGVDAVIAVGGGSTIDTAKAVRVLLVNDGELDVARFIFEDAPQVIPNIPIVIIPTTAGTGSEGTEGSMLTHIDENGEHWKKILECKSNSAIDFSIIDPELALGTPRHISMGCAFDVLAHATETSMTVLTSPLLQGMAKTAIGLFHKSVGRIYDDIYDLKARTDMALACAITSTIMNRSYVNANHAFGHALGSVFRVHHGVACGVFLPAVLEYYAEVASEQISDIGAIFGTVRERDETNAVYAERFARVLHRFASGFGIDLKNIVPEKESCYSIIPQALADYSWRLGLRELDEAGAKWIIDRTYEY